MRRLRGWVGWLACALVLGACAQLTEVVVVVDTDLRIPDEIDEFRIDVTTPDGEELHSEAILRGGAGLPPPRTLGIVHRGGPLDGLTVHVTGWRGNERVIERRARLAFQPGRVIVLRMDLLRSCLGRSCPKPDEETCVEGVCRDIDVDSSRLPDWDGRVGRLDASSSDAWQDAGAGPDAWQDAGAGPDAWQDAGADACVAADERCNERDDDCDGRVDETFDLATDPMNCGQCGRSCGAHASCLSGRCECDAGFADCNGELADGCEADLSSAATCGDCTTSCSGGTPLCARVGDRLTCVASCGPGQTLCGTSCVDTDTHVLHCGGCDRPCPARANATATCEGGMCRIASCNAGYADCNRIDSDGCEVDTRTNAMNCGMCGRSCGANASCSSGSCVCNLGYGDCDGNPANGCEQPLTTLSHCGACGRTCWRANATVTCADGVCRIASCNAGYADCNGVDADGCEVDTRTDPMNCGMCGRSCGANTSCRSGRCECNSGYGNCDGNSANGCEQALNTLSHCGACGATCWRANATATCSTGTCQIAMCNAGYEDCDGNDDNGCEVNLQNDNRHCGWCGRVCDECCVRGTCATGSLCW